MATRSHSFIYPDKPRPGDRVAILSPSMGLPGRFPAVYEQGLQRLREVFGLVPVEYPTTRTMDAPLEDRARDVRMSTRPSRTPPSRPSSAPSGARTRSSC